MGVHDRVPHGPPPGIPAQNNAVVMGVRPADHKPLLVPIDARHRARTASVEALAAARCCSSATRRAFGSWHLRAS